MQTQAILNTKSNVSFQSKDKLGKASRFVNMDDAQLQLLAYNSSVDKEKDKKAQRKIFGLFCAMPIVDTVARGVLAENVVEAFASGNNWESAAKCKFPASLSEKLYVSGRTAVSWGFALATVGLYSLVKKEIVENSPGLKHFDREHPITSFLTDVGIIMGAFVLGSKGIRKLYEKAKEKYPEANKNMEQKIINTCEKIDNTALNKKVLPEISQKLATFVQKAPFLAKAGKFALANSVWILLGAALYKMVKHADGERNRVEENYRILKNAQLQTAKHLINTLSIERDVLAQDQPELAADMRRAINGKNPVSNKEIREIQKKSKVYEDEKLRVQIRENLEAKNAEQIEKIDQVEEVNQPEQPLDVEVIYLAKITNGVEKPKENSEE